MAEVCLPDCLAARPPVARSIDRSIEQQEYPVRKGVSTTQLISGGHSTIKRIKFI